MDFSERAQITKHDGSMFVYNFGVILTGGLAAMRLDITDIMPLMGITFVFAIIWTLYFKFSMLGRLADHPLLGADDEEAAESG